MRYLVRTYPALIPLIVPSYRVSSRFLFLLYGIAEVSTVYSYSSFIGQLDHTYSREKIRFGLTFAGNQQKGGSPLGNFVESEFFTCGLTAVRHRTIAFAGEQY